MILFQIVFLYIYTSVRVGSLCHPCDTRPAGWVIIRFLAPSPLVKSMIMAWVVVEYPLSNASTTNSKTFLCSKIQYIYKRYEESIQQQQQYNSTLSSTTVVVVDTKLKTEKWRLRATQEFIPAARHVYTFSFRRLLLTLNTLWLLAVDSTARSHGR